MDVKNRERLGNVRPEDIEAKDVSGLASGARLRVEIPDGDSVSAMLEAIEEKAFPHLFKVRRESGIDVPEAELREAVNAELQTLVKASWRKEHEHEHEKRGDLESSVPSAVMGAPPRLVKRWVEAAKGKPPAPRRNKPKFRFRR